MNRELEERLSRPDDATVRALVSIDGDILILGAGGKMGTDARANGRYVHSTVRGVARGARRVIAVSRFSNEQPPINSRVTVWTFCERTSLIAHSYQSLPKSQNVIWMVGQKFGSTGDPVGTWGTQCVGGGLWCRPLRELPRVVWLFVGKRVRTHRTGAWRFN